MDMGEMGVGGAEGAGAMVPWKGEASLFDRAEILKNVRRKYENLMAEYHEGSDDVMKGEMTWFSAGIRIGVGVGLGVCLGLGLGVGSKCPHLQMHCAPSFHCSLDDACMIFFNAPKKAVVDETEL